MVGSGIRQEESSAESGSQPQPNLAAPADAIPHDIAYVYAGGEKFPVYKAFFTEGSSYFDKSLNGVFEEGRTQTIVLEDVSAVQFKVYWDIINRFHFNPEYRLDGEKIGYEKLIYLWMLSDRFMNINMRTMAYRAIGQRFECYSVANWRRMFKDSTMSSCKGRIRGLQELTLFCIQNSVRVYPHLLWSAANAPPQVIIACIDKLEPSFGKRLWKAFARRYIEPRLKCKEESEVVSVTRKRQIGEDDGGVEAAGTKRARQ